MEEFQALDLERIMHTDFQKHLNQIFTVTFSKEDKYELELIEVKELIPNKGMNIIPFSLFFRAGGEQEIFSQGTYQIKDPQGRSYNLFMIPRQPDQEYIYYEIISN